MISTSPTPETDFALSENLGTSAHQPINTSITPMMRQYFDIKHRHPDAILFYRIGDFYEMFYDDAVEASKILDLTLTSRNKNDENPIPLCGVPYHAAESYLAKLIEHGRKVVVCDQVEDPQFAKGIVRREITRIITPGTVVEAQSLSAARHNFLMSVCGNGDAYSCAVCDVTTGRLEYFPVASAVKLGDEISRLDVREIIHPERERGAYADVLKGRDGIFTHAVAELTFDADHARDLLLKQFATATLEALGIKDAAPEIAPLGAILAYLKDAKLLAEGLLQHPVQRLLSNLMALDETTTAHLELFYTLREHKKHGTLLWHLDGCLTPMGSRRLADMIGAPLTDIDAIRARHSAVAELLASEDSSEELRTALAKLPDLERLANRFVIGNANPRDANALGVGADRLGLLKSLLGKSATPLTAALGDSIGDFSALHADLARTLSDNPPLSLNDGSIIRDGVSPELDELRAIERGGKGHILEIERRERESTGINSLKVRYNQVFGYYIEVTHMHAAKVPSRYIRKQTLSNAERYITDELKGYEAKILGAGERIRGLERDLFGQLCERVRARAFDLKTAAGAVGMADVLLNFAEIARRYRYERPDIVPQPVMELKDARHPILERLEPSGAFVPNDIELDPLAPQIIITGPNMAGKSTLMRMTALIAVMAQAGSFVPCASATIGVCDRIFTRVGAHDHLQKGLSTFMVEMVETARILREVTPKSLVLLDEIGRGTSTFDGLSIAWAVAEDLHDRARARTLFATHYHELCDLAEERRGIRNFHMAVKEFNGKIVFLRKLMVGGTNRSYGVAVAGMAGLPATVVKRAREILKLLEVKDLSFQAEVAAQNSNQPSLFDAPSSCPSVAIMTELKALQPESMTPIEALTALDGICRRARGE